MAAVYLSRPGGTVPEPIAAVATASSWAALLIELAGYAQNGQRRPPLKAPGSFDDLVAAKAVIEIRYPKAHKYWDTSGNLIVAIEDALPELECMGIGKRGFEFKPTKGESAVRECGVNWNQTWFDVNVDLSAGHFEKMAGVFWPLVVSGHDIDKLTRVGSRHWLVFATETSAEADGLLGELKVWSFNDGLTDLGGPDARGVALRMVHHEPERRIRFELTAGDHVVGGKKLPGILVDIDFSVEEDLSVSGFDLSDFLQWNQRYMRDKVHRVLRARQ